MLSQLYGFAGSAAKFAVEHIETLKAAENILANRCGQVLEAANVGFGMGAETALILIGVGQGLLGNPLTGATAVSATNPIVMTCAAVGAIHYGWKAMSDNERDALLSSVSAAFKVGVEFIRSVANFALDVIQSLMSRENLEQLKKMVVSAAATFGRHLSDITGAFSDRVAESAKYVSAAAGRAGNSVWARLPSIRAKSPRKP
nr:hypothetical protein [uncultured Sphingomonas sp.]